MRFMLYSIICCIICNAGNKVNFFFRSVSLRFRQEETAKNPIGKARRHLIRAASDWPFFIDNSSGIRSSSVGFMARLTSDHRDLNFSCRKEADYQVRGRENRQGEKRYIFPPALREARKPSRGSKPRRMPNLPAESIQLPRRRDAMWNRIGPTGESRMESGT